MTDTIPAPVQALLGLFSSELAQVKFPDMDAEVLARATDEVKSAADEVARMELELEAARAVLNDKQESLLARSQRALAYARVFAEEDAELAARIDAIALPRLRRTRPEAERDLQVSEAMPIRRRGPKPKAHNGEVPANLFATEIGNDLSRSERSESRELAMVSEQ